MVNFNYYNPTEIVFGPDKELEVSKLIKKYQGKKVLIHYGGKSAEKSGLLNRIINSLNENEIEHISFGGVVANPRLTKVEKGINLVKTNKIDFILAVGGGSVIDSSKAIAAGTLTDKPVWNLMGNYNINKSLPLGVILTIAAAGSEMSSGAVITNDKTNLKRDFGGPAIRPKFAILNPQLTYTLPKYQTAAGAADIIMHTVERYFTHADTIELTDAFAKTLIQNVIKHTKIVLEHPKNYQSRAEIMWSGTLSHNGLTGIRSDGGDWASHQIGHELSAKYDLAHGPSLTIIWPAWARYVWKSHPEKFKKFSIEIMGAKEDNQTTKEIIETGIQNLEIFFKEIKMPTSLKDLAFKVTNEDIKDMALKATQNNTFSPGNIRSLDFSDIVSIYKLANK